MNQPFDDIDFNEDVDDEDDADNIVRHFEDNLNAIVNDLPTPLALRHADHQPGSQARWSEIHANRARDSTAPDSTLDSKTNGHPRANAHHVDYANGITSNRNPSDTIRRTNTISNNYNDGGPSSRRGADIASPSTNVPLDMRQSTLDHYARSHLINRKDIGKLAELHSDYHGNSIGFSRINEKDLADAGYKFTHHYGIHEAAICYNDLIFIHTSMVSAWPDPKDPSKGPQVHRIITKSLTAFPQLHSTSGRAIVEFYDKMQVSGTNYILPLTPFD
jgi:hypothetical protein